MKNKKHGLTVRDLTYIALLAALIAVCSWISLPTKPPFTLQTFAVFTAALLLGGIKGTVTVAVYLLLGIVGIPVFSGFGSGIGHVLASTGGYLVGFLPAAFICGTIGGCGAKHIGRAALGCILGLLSCYAFGSAWFMLVYSHASGAIGLASVLSMCVFPFVLPDLVKIALSILLTRVLFPHLYRG